jgi:hypothetical protein
MHKRLFFLLATLMTLTQAARAQELQCAVSVSAPTVGSDREIYQQMQDAIIKYVNLRKWTDLVYEPNERIKCRMQFIINDRPAVDEFKGTLQVQLIRPVYKSSYETKVVDIQDKEIAFKFVPFQPLEFSENAYIDQLTSILNFYAFMLIGFDQETFELGSGVPYFQRAQQVVSMAATSSGPGWSNLGDTRNRYYLNAEMLDNSLRQIHSIFYTYHRQGLDQMEKNVGLGRASVISAIKELQKLNQRFPAKFITRVFMTAKSAEIIEIFKKADMRDKSAIIPILLEIDPANANEYEAIRAEK